jgi:probable HAF family extracellular repeat protein
MFRNTNHLGRWIVAAMAIGLVCASATLAKKPPKPPPDDDDAPYDLIDLLGFENGDLGYQSVAKFVTARDPEGGVLIYGTSYHFFEDLIPENNPAVWYVHADGTFAEPEDRGQPTFAGGAKPRGFNFFGIGVGTTHVGFEQDENGEWVLPGYVDLPSGYREVSGRPINGFTHAYAINDEGMIVGDMAEADGLLFGCLWEPDDGVPGAGAHISFEDYGFRPMDINNSGVMAGNIARNPAIAWFERDGDDVWLEFRVLEDPRYQIANALNDWPAGDQYPGLTVVGFSHEDNGRREAFAWRPFDPENPTTFLGQLDGGHSSEALDVNKCGEIVGWSDTRREGWQGFLYANGTLANLNELADVGRRTLQWANGINEDGDIVGYMHVPRPISEQRGFLLRRKDSN